MNLELFIQESDKHEPGLAAQVHSGNVENRKRVPLNLKSTGGKKINNGNMEGIDPFAALKSKYGTTSGGAAKAGGYAIFL